MTRWILPITGFTESPNKPTGIERLWREMRPYATKSCIVLTPRAWCDDMAGLARFMVRNSESRAVVCVVAYSWGAGFGFIEFARAAWVLGIRIVVAVLCDPVYRSLWLPHWLPLNVLSVTPWMRPVIQVPASVRYVRWVRQTHDLPRAHDLEAVDPAFTHIENPVLLPHSHGQIDESAVYRMMVLDAVDSFSSLRGGQ